MRKIIVTMGTCGISAGAKTTADELDAKIKKDSEKNSNLSQQKVLEKVKRTACIGLCAFEPTVIVHEADTINDNTKKMYFFINMKGEEILNDLYDFVAEKNNLTPLLKENLMYEGAIKDINEILFKGQKRIVLRNAGLIDPYKLDDYIDRGGYQTIDKIKENKFSKDELLQIIKDSGLRGRGGGGFPTGIKWEILKKQNNTIKEKYIICNADEGDPGAFMDRAVLEGDPHSVLEGMQIAAFITEATKAIIYVRAEYPLAIKTLKVAIIFAEKAGKLLVPVEIKEGAGAFVCGEETALIHSVEGKRGMPRKRPPYPAVKGLYGNPTNINNVETLAAVPWITANAGEYEKLGYAKSRGTKVFALAGDIVRGGLAEVPFGTTLKELIFDIGGGIKNNKKFKAVQVGGPSGGCLPIDKLDLPIDYETLRESGAIVGSGGAIAMDESSCMVDIAKFFMTFVTGESCGKCTYCRIGTKRLLELLTKFSCGLAETKDIDELESLAKKVGNLSLCGLGQTAPNPILSTLKYFRHEYEEHIGRVCKSQKCEFCPREDETVQDMKKRLGVRA